MMDTSQISYTYVRRLIMEITTNTVQDFLESADKSRQEDLLSLLHLFEELSGYQAKMWGSIVGFGKLHYKYESGHEGDMPLIGFANRKQAITLYVVGDTEAYPQLQKLGKHKTSKACIYIHKLSDIDLSVLTMIIKEGIQDTLKRKDITVVSY